MAGKTLISGTAYDISGGKTLVNGTAYSIAGGKTLVSGTSYDISFGVDLAELFSGMTVLATAGRNSSSAGSVSITPSTYLTDNETAYVFSFCNGYMSVTKCTYANPVSAEVLYQSSTSYGNIQLCAWSIDAIYYRNAFKVDGTSDGTSVRGATLALVQFDQPEAKVDAVLSALQYKTKAGRNTASSSGVYLGQDHVLAGDIVFAGYNQNLGISEIIDKPINNALYGLRTYYTTHANGTHPHVTIDDTSGGSGRLWLGTGIDSTSLYGGTLHVVQYVE